MEILKLELSISSNDDYVNHSSKGGPDALQNKQLTSRTKRQRKRRKNKRLLYSCISIAILFSILLFVFIFTGNKDMSETNEAGEQETKMDGIKEHDDNTSNEEATIHSSTEEDPFQDVVIKRIESDDPNVIEALEGDWPPIGTDQVGPHTTDYEDGSADRLEIKEAILAVTEISEDNLIEHWIGNGGDQKVIATVEDRSNEQYFRISLSWIEAEGWQVTLVEQIKQLEIP